MKAIHMKERIILLGIILLSVWAPVAMAREAPSFDCDKASLFIEQVICEDRELSRLDLLMKGEHPEEEANRPLNWKWLKECDYSQGYFNPLDMNRERWLAGPCIADKYRERLTRLGIDPGPAPSHPKTIRGIGPFIHPACLNAALVSPAGRPISLTACTRGVKHIPLIPKKDHWNWTKNSLGGGGAYIVETTLHTDRSLRQDLGSISYDIIGKTSDGRLIVAFNKGAGNMKSAGLLLVDLHQRLDPEQILDDRGTKPRDIFMNVQLWLDGGDRSQGGFLGAEVDPKRGIIIHTQFSEQLLVDLISGGRAPMEGLGNCMACSVALVGMLHPFDGSEAKPLGACLLLEGCEKGGKGCFKPTWNNACVKWLEPEEKRNGVRENLGRESKSSQCLFSAIRQVSPTMPHDLDQKQFPDVIKAYQRCLDRR